MIRITQRNFEHNYGHDYKNLCFVMTMLMMLAFLIDQVQQLCCKFYQKARKHVSTLRGLFEKVRNSIDIGVWENWHHLYTFIGDPSSIGSGWVVNCLPILRSDQYQQVNTLKWNNGDAITIYLKDIAFPAKNYSKKSSQTKMAQQERFISSRMIYPLMLTARTKSTKNGGELKSFINRLNN
ncbi:MAG: hypothetical protein Q8R83_05230 [Legionellaceae bacterium]|nr:hypothetical protein [Legionellaceae bacterium]